MSRKCLTELNRTKFYVKQKYEKKFYILYENENIAAKKSDETSGKHAKVEFKFGLKRKLPIATMFLILSTEIKFRNEGNYFCLGELFLSSLFLSLLTRFCMSTDWINRFYYSNELSNLYIEGTFSFFSIYFSLVSISISITCNYA